jgi:hypothetical protein
MFGGHQMDVMNKLSREKSYAEAGMANALSPRQMSLTEQLEARLQMHREEAAKLEETIDAVKKNPEIERVLNLLQRL